MNLSWQNVLDGQGIGITLTGMLIVFSGLALISLFISVLPKLLELPDRVARSREAVQQTPQAAEEREPDEEELIALISLVLHEEMERSCGEKTQLTISRQQPHGSIWASAGKMRSLSEGGSYA